MITKFYEIESGLKSQIKNIVSQAQGIFAMVAFAIVVIPSALLIVITPGLNRRRRLAGVVSRLCLRAAGMSLSVEGLDRLPKNEACVVVANHASYLDGIVLQGMLPPTFCFVIKREMEKVPLVNFLLMRLGSQYVDRGNRQKGGRDALRILRVANAGQALGFFPEGTFEKEPGLRHFHLSAFTTAARNNLPVCPTIIEGTRAILPSDVWLPKPGPIRVRVLDKINAQGRDAVSVRAFRDQARKIILNSFEEPDLSQQSEDRVAL